MPLTPINFTDGATNNTINMLISKKDTVDHILKSLNGYGYGDVKLYQHGYRIFPGKRKFLSVIEIYGDDIVMEKMVPSPSLPEKGRVYTPDDIHKQTIKLEKIYYKIGKSKARIEMLKNSINTP